MTSLPKKGKKWGPIKKVPLHLQVPYGGTGTSINCTSPLSPCLCMLLKVAESNGVLRERNETLSTGRAIGQEFYPSTPTTGSCVDYYCRNQFFLSILGAKRSNYKGNDSP
jgi:hypothetical protein